MIGRIHALLRQQSTSDTWKMLLKDTIQTKFFRQGMQMSLWRIISLGFAALASIWAARCLGPENFGISGMIVSTVTQLSLFVHLNQGGSLIRNYKNRPTLEAKNELISIVFTYRFTATLLIILLAIPVVLSLRLSPKWYLALISGAPYFLFSVNIADWILVAEGKMAESYKALTIQAITTAVLYLVFFRPGIHAGYDVIVQAFACFLSFLANWYFAVGGRTIQLYQLRLLPKIIPILKEGRWLVLMGFVYYIYGALESPLLGYLYSVKEMGIYRAGTSLVAGFQALLTMLPALLYPRFIDWGKESAFYLWERQKKIALVLFVLFVPISLGTFLIAPVFFHFLYSSTYERAAYPFAILLTSRLTGIIGGIFNMGLMAHHQDKTMVLIMCCVAFISLCLNLALIPYFGAMAAASINLTSETMILMGSFFFCRRYVRLQKVMG